jgi:hypothetical protein
MNTIDTGLVNLFTQKNTTAQWIPCTGPLNTTLIRQVRVSRLLESVSSVNFTCVPAYQTSNDGVTWSTGADFGIYSAATGWSYIDEDDIDTNIKNFVRFGFNCKNASGTRIEQAVAQLQVQIAPIVGNTIAAERVKVWSAKDDSTVNFVPIPSMPIVQASAIEELRATTQLIANSQYVSIQPAYQLSDDGVSWYDGTSPTPVLNGCERFGTAVTTVTTAYGTVFASFSPAKPKRFVRFGLASINSVAVGTSTKPETGLAALRIDYRRTP